ncbi:TetR/AcrR family transcriptional regulator, partial [Mesorhizobium japonicum]|uniref:TetR/AcrR family transcriptional regulator n=1 Tax=Mesorhizobium japonicum TaxID=2066070 RepID=UPI003B58FC1B
SRPRSDERRASLLQAATRVISANGLAAASTSVIAQEAGVSNGSLFVYFETKSALLTELYVALKKEMGDAAVAGLPSTGDPRERLHRMWVQWLAWATSNPDKRRALAQLEAADDITEQTHALVRESQRDMAALVELSRAGGALAGLPISFALTITSAIADATMDLLIRDPHGPAERGEAAFDAVWRVLAG